MMENIQCAAGGVFAIVVLAVLVAAFGSSSGEKSHRDTRSNAESDERQARQRMRRLDEQAAERVARGEGCYQIPNIDGYGTHSPQLSASGQKQLTDGLRTIYVRDYPAQLTAPED